MHAAMQTWLEWWENHRVQVQGRQADTRGAGAKEERPKETGASHAETRSTEVGTAARSAGVLGDRTSREEFV